MVKTKKLYPKNAQELTIENIGNMVLYFICLSKRKNQGNMKIFPFYRNTLEIHSYIVVHDKKE